MTDTYKGIEFTWQVDDDYLSSIKKKLSSEQYTFKDEWLYSKELHKNPSKISSKIDSISWNEIQSSSFKDLKFSYGAYKEEVRQMAKIPPKPVIKKSDAKPGDPLCFCANTDLHFEDNPKDPSSIQSKHWIDTPPWAEHIKCAFNTDDNAWKPLWPNFKPKEFNLVSAAADFYLYEYLIHVSGVDKIPQDLYDEFIKEGFEPGSVYATGLLAKEKLKALEEAYAPVIKDYLHYAIASELRHDSCFAQSFTANGDCGFWGWSQLIKRTSRLAAATYARELFDQSWRSCFGGKRWAQIATILQHGERGEISGYEFNNHLFLDRVFSLQHNTGTVFSKCEWGYKNDYKLDYNKNPHFIENMKIVLDAHHDGNIRTLVDHASFDALRLVKDHLLGLTDMSFDSFTSNPGYYYMKDMKNVRH